MIPRFFMLWTLMITGHSCYPSISSKPSLLEYWIKVDTELPPSSTSLSPLEIPHNIGSGAKSADDIYALPAIEDKLYGYIPESFGKNIPQTLTGWLNWSVKQDYPTYQFLAKLGKLQPRFGAIGKLAESMEHLGPTISIHEPNAEGGIHSQDDTAAEDSALKASFLGRVNNGIPVEHLITIETKHLPSSLSPFKNPQSISSDAKSADESHAVPMIERSSSVYGYVPGSLKNVARAITGWLNRPGEDDYSGYQQLAKLVRLRASDEDVRKIAESINHSGPTIVIRDSKAGGKIESKNDTDAVVFAFKAALRVLEKSSLSYRERYWALGLFACLRNKLIPSILHSCDQHLLDPQKRKYRGQLEIFLMGGNVPFHEVQRLWSDADIVAPTNSKGEEVLKRVEMLDQMFSEIEKDKEIEIKLSDTFIYMKEYLRDTIFPAKEEDLKFLKIAHKIHSENENSSSWEKQWMTKMWSHICGTSLK